VTSAYVEGTNLTIDYRWADGKPRSAARGCGRPGALTGGRHCDGWPASHPAAREATTAIPIVMAVDYDPVGAGFRRQPGAARREHHGDECRQSGTQWEAAGVAQSDGPPARPRRPPLELRGAQCGGLLAGDASGCPHLGGGVQSLEVRAPGDLEAAFQAARKGRANALTVLTDPVTLYHEPS